MNDILTKANNTVTVTVIYRFKGDELLGIYIPDLDMEVYGDDYITVTAKVLEYLKAIYQYHVQQGNILQFNCTDEEALSFGGKSDFIGYLAI